MSKTIFSQQDGSLNFDNTSKNIFRVIRELLLTCFAVVFCIPFLEQYPTLDVYRYSLREYIESTQLYKQAQKSEIHGLLLSSLVKKAVEDHNEKQVLHKINIKTLTPEQFKAVLDPCTVWDYRERNKCQEE